MMLTPARIKAFSLRPLIVIAALAFCAILAPAAQASSAGLLGEGPFAHASSYPANCGGSGMIAGATLTYDGVTHSTFTAGEPGLMVCQTGSSADGEYGVRIGLAEVQQGGTTVNEDLGAVYGAKRYTVVFTVAAGQAPQAVMGVGTVSSFDVAATQVTLVVNPVTTSTLRPEDGTPNSPGPTSIAGSEQTKVFMGMRYGPQWSSLPGMMVSANAAASLFQFSGSCAAASAAQDTRPGGDGGTGPGSGGTGGAAPPAFKADLVGPHFKTDGTTVAQGSLRAVIPAAAAQSCFGASGEALRSLVSVSRTEDGTTAPVTEAGTGGLRLTVDVDASGNLEVAVPVVTFSSPSYNIRFSKSKTTPLTGVKWSATKGAISASFKASTKVKKYTIKAVKSGKSKAGSCAVKGTKVTCSVKKLAKGSYAATISSTLKAGGAGPTAARTLKVN